jgi:hypothetical protein
MQPSCEALITIAELEYDPIGFYDVPLKEPFEPFCEPKHCLFENFEDWQDGYRTLLSPECFRCMGAGYWICGVQKTPRDKFVNFLQQTEGLKKTPEQMNQWLDNTRAYQIEHSYAIVGPLVNSHYKNLNTVTFFVNPDQLGLFILGANYDNASLPEDTVIAPFNAGCALITMFSSVDKPRAIIGATDIAMRQHLPPDILAFTVNKPMYEQLCNLNSDSFLHKAFWKNLQESRYDIDVDEDDAAPII